MPQSVIPSSGPASKASPPSRPRYRPSAANPILELGTGRVLVLLAFSAFGVLRDLHLRCTTDKSEVSNDVIRGLSHHQAKRAYRSALACVIASFTIMGSAERRACFETLVNFCTDKESMGGLESVFLTLLASLSSAEPAPIADTPRGRGLGEGLWERIGLPRTMGGGHRFGIFFDVATNCMTRFERASLASLSSAQLASLIGEGAGMASALESNMQAAASMNAPIPAEDGAGVSGGELAGAICAVAGTAPEIGTSLAVEAFPEGGIPGIGTGQPGTGIGMPGVGHPGCTGAPCGPGTCSDAAVTCCGCCCCCGGGCAAMPDSGAYRSALLILGAQTLATRSILSPDSARAFSIQIGPVTSLIIRVPTLRSEFSQ
jgi:hypothetical protein